MKHPNLWHFVRTLKDEERSTAIVIQAAERGDLPPLRRKKWRALERRINNLKRQYADGERDLTSYWSAIAHAVKVFV